MKNALETIAVLIVCAFIGMGVVLGIAAYWALLFILEVTVYTVIIYPLVKFVIPIFAPTWIVASWGLLESAAFSTVLSVIVTFSYTIIRKLRSK